MFSLNARARNSGPIERPPEVVVLRGHAGAHIACATLLQPRSGHVPLSANDPVLLPADEPTSALDTKSCQNVREILRDPAHV